MQMKLLLALPLPMLLFFISFIYGNVGLQIQGNF